MLCKIYSRLCTLKLAIVVNFCVSKGVDRAYMITWGYVTRSLSLYLLIRILHNIKTITVMFIGTEKLKLLSWTAHLIINNARGVSSIFNNMYTLQCDNV